MKPWINYLWPRPCKLSRQEIQDQEQKDLAIDTRIKKLDASVDPSLALEAARRISAEEDGRKAGAESRATTFIAAVATLIPLMTWALGNTDAQVCTKGWGCSLWTAIFVLSVIYFLTAAYWALQSLAVANYHVIGVEEVVKVQETGHADIKLLRDTLLSARHNRVTINQKITYIKVAQRQFFNGLLVMGFLLMLDPILRFGIIGSIYSELKTPTPTAKIKAQEPIQLGGAQAPVSASQPTISQEFKGLDKAK